MPNNLDVEKEVEVLEIDGKEYAVLEEFDNHLYATNVENPDDAKVFKVDGEEIEELTGTDFSVALAKFYEKYKYLLNE